MEAAKPDKKINWEKISFIAAVALGILFLILLVSSLLPGNKSRSTWQKTSSDLISTKEIAKLSVSEFVYNGIAQTYKENGENDYNVLYNSTVKVSVDADQITYSIDEKNKKVTFVLPEFKIEKPVIVPESIKTIPTKNDLYVDKLIELCRNDALTEAKKSDKLMASAQENLKAIMEAWYSPVFEGYGFEFQFDASKGGEAK